MTLTQEKGALNLADLIDGSKIDDASLKRRYPADMKLAPIMLGVIPNCHAYLGIWPVGITTYGLLIPNLMNMPLFLWGRSPASKELLALVVHFSSRSAGCMYCTAHSCTLMLRRGASADLFGSPGDDASSLSPAQVAARDFAVGVGRVPSSLSASERDAMRQHHSPEVIEWLVHAAAMMGFLNKFMDGLGVPLEQAVVDDVGALLSPSGWAPGKHQVKGAHASGRPGADSLRTQLSVLPILPRALFGNVRLTRGVPSRWPAMGHFLEEVAGYDFPMLASLRHKQPLKALGATIRDNASAASTTLGLRRKHLCGLVLATTLASKELLRGCRQMALRVGDAKVVESVAAFASHDTQLDDLGSIAAALHLLSNELDEVDRAALVVAKATASSPAHMTSVVIDRYAGQLSPAQTVELLVWLGVLSAVHRIDCFYGSAG